MTPWPTLSVSGASHPGPSLLAIATPRAICANAFPTRGWLHCAVVPPVRPGDREGQIALVWDLGTEGEDLPHGAAEQIAALGGQIDRTPETVRVPWTHSWRETGYRHTDWKLIVIDLADQ